MASLPCWKTWGVLQIHVWPGQSCRCSLEKAECSAGLSQERGTCRAQENLVCKGCLLFSPVRPWVQAVRRLLESPLSFLSFEFKDGPVWSRGSAHAITLTRDCSAEWIMITVGASSSVETLKLGASQDFTSRDGFPQSCSHPLFSERFLTCPFNWHCYLQANNSSVPFLHPKHPVLPPCIIPSRFFKGRTERIESKQVKMHNN